MKKILFPILILSMLAIISPVLGATGNETTAKDAIVNYRFEVGSDAHCYSRYPCYPNGSVCLIPPETSCSLCSLEGQPFNGSTFPVTPAPYCLRHITIDNVERKNFNILVKIFPSVEADCFSFNQTCNITDFNYIVRLKIIKPNGTANYVELDTTSCWNWWNNTAEDKITAKKACPVGSIYITSDEDDQRIEFEWGNRTGTDIDYAVVFLGYSTSTVNVEEKISPALKSVMTSVATLISINLDIWKVLYYLFLIMAILVAVIFIVGFLPLSLKWILKKITE
jgi:hypothetical protein